MARVPEVALIALSVGKRTVAPVQGQVVPKIGTATLKNTAKVRRTCLPVLNQEHPLTQHVTSEIIPFGNTTASYNTILVLHGKLLWICFVSKNVE